MVPDSNMSWMRHMFDALHAMRKLRVFFVGMQSRHDLQEQERD